ncbi:hypothetical protein TNCV_2068411 [Trichonephila clavipes]|uniref:Uncharacterized protein n=1 Tax=Trichonephila clavipes TaxID=2585209 RepID=A0A8X6W374_TRICX|nr:hypothetical protein TNCV_2068291 [Trichonephila clavipes]GFY27212.1 hypothetical protein TNCV_2068331 [Trichonephila clavipes]GFY27220.1 hypothetical protein TNCV_2068411 [Trichonephila clavipes]
MRPFYNVETLGSCPGDIKKLLLFPIPLEQESLHQDHLTIQRNSLTRQALLFIQLSQGNAPAVQKMNRREQGQVKKDFTPCAKVILRR